MYQVTHVWLYERMVLKHLRADAPPELRHILLEEGRIVERGRHDELLQAEGVYRRLYELQFQT